MENGGLPFFVALPILGERMCPTQAQLNRDETAFSGIGGSYPSQKGGLKPGLTWA